MGFVVFVSIFLFAGEPNLQPALGKVVLRLRYRGEASKLQKNPYTIGMFVGGEYEEPCEYFGSLTGTDWDGCIYIFDPIKPNFWVLKRFDRQGKFQEAWNPIRARFGESVAVTKDGYIWTGIRWVDTDRLRGFPILVYRKGRKEPVIDWRRELPRHVKEVRDKVSAEVGINWEKLWKERQSHAHPWDLIVLELKTGPNQVAFSLGGEVLRKEEDRIAKFLWMLCSSDGKEIFEAHIDVTPPSLEFDGNLWMYKLEREGGMGSLLKKVWFFKKGEEEGEPLIDFEGQKPDWIKILFGEQGRTWIGPLIDVDTKGNIYLTWQRGPSRPYQQIKVEGRYMRILAPTIGGGESALVVLDKSRRFLTYLPWQQTYLVLPPDWIKPLPDGSGFYRIEYREREAVIYFHPLPK
ncbi:MAG: hypothetical protein QXP16_05690 [Candidatus Bathyarchaeia archaeon]